MTDCEVWRKGYADEFYAFTENIMKYIGVQGRQSTVWMIYKMQFNIIKLFFINLYHYTKIMRLEIRFKVNEIKSLSGRRIQLT